MHDNKLPEVERSELEKEAGGGERQKGIGCVRYLPSLAVKGIVPTGPLEYMIWGVQWGRPNSRLLNLGIPDT